jgi:hypothetical protein
MRWASSQPAVVEARTEYWAADGRRRSDVEIRLNDGTQLVVEVQQQPLTDDAWTRRHDDYVSAGLVDVWLWHPTLGVPGIARDEPQCNWLLASDLSQIGAPLARSHPRDEGWWEQPNFRLYGLHYPPCPGDAVITRWTDINQYSVDGNGIRLPSSIQRELREQAARAASRARQTRERITATPVPTPRRAKPSPPIRQPTHVPRQPTPTAPPEPVWHEVHRIDALPPHADSAQRRYRCRTCGLVNGDVLADGKHKLISFP